MALTIFLLIVVVQIWSALTIYGQSDKGEMSYLIPFFTIVLLLPLAVIVFGKATIC